MDRPDQTARPDRRAVALAARTDSSEAMLGRAVDDAVGHRAADGVRRALSSVTSLSRILSGRPPAALVVDRASQQVVVVGGPLDGLLDDVSLPAPVSEVVAALGLTRVDGEPLGDEHPLRLVAAGRDITGTDVRTRSGTRMWTVGVGVDDVVESALGVLVLMVVDETELSNVSLTTAALGTVDLSFTIADCRRDDMPLVYVNPAFETLTGYPVDEVVGRNCRFLQGDDTDQVTVRRMRGAIDGGHAAVVTVRNYRKDGTPFDNEVTLSPIVEDGELAYMVGVQRDVTEHVRNRQERDAAAAQGERARRDAEAARDQAVREAARAERAHERIAFLDTASAELDANLSMGELAERLCGLIVPDHAEAAAVVVAGERNVDRFVSTCHRGDHVDPDALMELAWSHVGVSHRRVIDDERTRRHGWARIDVWPLDLERRDGVVVVAHDEPPTSTGLLDALVRRARPAFVAAHRFSQRAHIAEALSELLLPPVLPTIPGFELAGRYEPAGVGLDVGGDFYDVFATERGWVLLLGDVCGKGPGAAAVTGIVRATVRALADRVDTPSAMLRAVNDAVLAQVNDDRFVTAVCGMLDTPTGGDATLRFASGGHPLPMLVRDGLARQVGVSGQLLGILGEVDVTDTVIAVRPGDVMVMVTDGVLETPRDYREQEVLSAAAAAAHSAESVASAVLGTIVSGEHRRDDAAVIALRAVE